jgi:hypothetical protein
MGIEAQQDEITRERTRDTREGRGSPARSDLVENVQAYIMSTKFFFLVKLLNKKEINTSSLLSSLNQW